MPSVTCFRCGKGGYTSPRQVVHIPEPLVEPSEGVLDIVAVEPELCAACRAHAARENAEAAARSAQRGEAG